MKKSKEWFSVSKEGLKELQAGKPKSHIVRELIQNALDENITICALNSSHEKGNCKIEIIDDNPEGFKDITDSYTMFQHTSKRDDPTKRGRFNMGEKQAFAVCNWAMVETTKGTVIFDNSGRSITKAKREYGSVITVGFKCTQNEYYTMLNEIKLYLIPKNIQFVVDGKQVEYVEPHKIFDASLLTEKQEDGILKRCLRKTQIHVIKNICTKHIIYEMGIPVSEIECDYDLDIQQKIPLSIDRETVLPSFLQDLYAEVLNNMHFEVTKESASQLWVREAISDERINKEAVKDIITKRFGEKTCIANPFDRISVDDAVANGYNVVHGSEMSKAEWDAVKESDAMLSSSVLFGKNFTTPTYVTELSSTQKQVVALVKKIAKFTLNIDVNVEFMKGQGNELADYGNRTLRFNLLKIPKEYFESYLNEQLLDLIIHELGHEKGMHTEASYHSAITMIGAKLTMKAWDNPSFFEVEI